MTSTFTLCIDCRLIRASGIGTYLRNVLSRLIARNSDWRFRLLGDLAELNELPWTQGANIERTAFTAKLYSIAEQTWWLRNPQQADLLWVPHYNIPIGWRGALLVTVHDVAHLVLTEHLSNPLKRMYATGLFQAVRHLADGIIFVSDFTRDEFLRVVGQPKRRFWSISEGVDPLWLGTDRADMAKLPGTGKPYVVFVGNIKPHKNLARLLDAFAQVRDRVPHDLVLVGKRTGFITGDTAVSAAAERLGASVRFTGEISDAGVRGLVAGADLLVMPSYYEGFGLPVVEAMACGCPVLAARAASLPAVGGDAVAYCDPLDTASIADALVRLLTDADLRADFVRRGRERALLFDWDKVAEQTAEAIQSLRAH